MKLAEALIIRADCQKRIGQLRDRLANNAQVQEGETPYEDPQQLLAELDAVVNQLTDLIRRINRTNSHTELREAVSLSDALAQRDTLWLKHNAYKSLINAASQRQSRYSASEIRQISTVDVAGLQSQTDQISRQIRELDTQIQSANWNIDLLE